MSKLLTTKEYEIYYYQVGFNKKVSVLTLMNFFQDIFVYQLESTGTGLDYLSNNSLSWVVSRWDIQIYKYPTYGEKIKVKLFHVSSKKYFIYKKYQVLNEDDEVISEAISLWTLINISTRKPCKINEQLYTTYGLSLTDNISLKIDKINPVEKIHLQKVFFAGFSDIDTNHHVNNVKYVSWALDTMPQELVNRYKLIRLKINYQKETKCNESIISSTEVIRDENKSIIRCLHEINDSNNSTLASLESIWKKVS